jgi:hypothetical protein
LEEKERNSSPQDAKITLAQLGFSTKRVLASKTRNSQSAAKSQKTMKIQLHKDRE